MIIYKITNRINGKIYVGQTIQTLAQRWKQHRDDAKKAKMAISCAIKKYGHENFTIEILEEVSTKSELDLLETQYINQLRSLRPIGYNVHLGGNQPIPVRSAEVIENHRQWMLLHNTWGFPKGHKHYKSKPIIAQSLVDGSEVFYESTHRLDLTQFNPKAIWRVLVGQRNKYKNFKWRYATENDIQNWTMKGNG